MDDVYDTTSTPNMVVEPDTERMASLPTVRVVQLTQCGLDQRRNSTRRSWWSAQQTNGRGQYNDSSRAQKNVRGHTDSIAQQTNFCRQGGSKVFDGLFSRQICDVNDAQGEHNAVTDCVTHGAQSVSQKLVKNGPDPLSPLQQQRRRKQL